MALNDYKITSTDEQGKLYTGMPRELADVFNTYQEVQTFMDSHGQLVKNKHNGLIDEVSQQLERITDKRTLKIYTVNNQTELDALIDSFASNFANDTEYHFTLNVAFSHAILGGGRLEMNGYKFLNGYEIQQLKTYANGGKTFERSKEGASWSAWKLNPTQDKIDISFPYNSGYVDYSIGSSYLKKDSLNKVEINVMFKNTGGTALPTTIELATLPVGYRPKIDVPIKCENGNGYIRSTGVVAVYSSTGTYNAFHIEYTAD